MSTILGHGRYGDFLRGHLGIDSNKPAASELLPDLTSILDIRGRTEDSYLALERRLTALCVRAAVAAQVSQVQLLNPSGSGVLAVVTALYARQPSAGTSLQFGAGTGVDGNFTTTYAADDTRWGTASRGALTVTGQQQSTFVNSQFLYPIWEHSGATMVYWRISEGDFIIAPGQGFSIANAPANTALDVWLRYYERPFLTTELRSTP